jgi:hypothetical protein
MQQIFDIPKRERETDVQHHSKANDFGTILKYLKKADLVIGKSYSTTLPRSSKVFLTRPLDKPQLDKPKTRTNLPPFFE